MNLGASTWQDSMRERPGKEVKKWNTNLARKALRRMTRSHSILRPVIQMGKKRGRKTYFTEISASTWIFKERTSQTKLEIMKTSLAFSVRKAVSRQDTRMVNGSIPGNVHIKYLIWDGFPQSYQNRKEHLVKSYIMWVQVFSLQFVTLFF